MGFSGGPICQLDMQSANNLTKKNSNAVIWRVLLTINRFAMVNFKDFFYKLQTAFGKHQKIGSRELSLLFDFHRLSNKPSKSA